MSATATGRGVKKDIPKAIECYKAAIEKVDSYACANLGELYEKGEGVRKNMKKAIEYYRLGAERKNTDCIEALERLGEKA